MKLAFAIAILAALQHAAVTRADCDFGSNYTSYWNNSDECPLIDVGIGIIRNFRESNTILSGDTNVTTTTYRNNMAIWRVGDKDSTVQCYPDAPHETLYTTYPNGSTFYEVSGDFTFGSNSVNDTVADGVPLSFPALYYFQGGRVEFWSNKGETGGAYWTYTKAEGDITNLCEVLGGGGAAPTPTPPTTEAPSSGRMAAVTIIPCVAAAMLNYFFS